MQHTRPPCPSPTPRACSNSCPLSQSCHPTISFSVSPFSCPQSFAASGSFPMKGGPWPRLNRDSKSKQDDWPEDTRKNWPCISNLIHLESVQLSLSEPACTFSTCIFSPNKHVTCLTAFHLFAEIFLQSRQVPGWALRPRFSPWSGNWGPTSRHHRL